MKEDLCLQQSCGGVPRGCSNPDRCTTTVRDPQNKNGYRRIALFDKLNYMTHTLLSSHIEKMGLNISTVLEARTEKISKS